MLSIRSSADMARALASPIDADLRQLLALRRDQLSEQDEQDLGALAHFVVAEPGDPPAIIDGALGFPVAVNLVDGVRLGDADFEPSWEWRQDHGGWFELAFILSDDGFAHVLLIPDRDDIDPTLLALCRDYA